MWKARGADVYCIVACSCCLLIADAIRLEEDVEEVEDNGGEDDEGENVDDVVEAGMRAVIEKVKEEDMLGEIEEFEADEKGWLDWWASESTGSSETTAAGLRHLFRPPDPVQAASKASRSKRPAKNTPSQAAPKKYPGGPSGSQEGSLRQSATGAEGSEASSGAVTPGAAPSAPSTHHALFACPRCEKKYQLRSSLNRHLRWECGKEPRFQCVLCSYRSKHKSHVVRHVKFAH
ncbi:zinc finger protein 467-like [Ischnura elegans]|uniref:zinc finger protein 467-like n=1 Tax=Ischnura elegans TaxID=197161 RepID=UPI001ED89B68|nr:zinc finger protein 467-like [Ischnura elegans]